MSAKIKKKGIKKKTAPDKHSQMDRILSNHIRSLVYSLVGILTIIFVSTVLGMGNSSAAIVVQEISENVVTEVFTKPEAEIKPEPPIEKIVEKKPLLQTMSLEKKKFEAVVPILMYHYIGPMEPSFDEIRRGLTVTPEVFRSQMKWLKDNGFITANLSQYFEAVLKGEKINPKTVIITFDDGYQNVYDNAVPVMREYGQTAVMFIITDNSGPVYMNWYEIKAIDEMGFEIGSHSLTHPYLNNLNNEDARNEIGKSKKVLENNLGHPVNFLCYPYGNYTWSIIDMVREAGYKGALTTENGAIITNENIFRMPRLRVKDDMGADRFASIINGILK